MHGRVLAKTLSTGQRETYRYDLAGNLISATGLDGSTTTFAYDALQRRTVVAYADGTVISTSYTPNGLPAEVTDGDVTTRFEYDALSRQIARTDPSGQTVRSSYDPAGNRISLESLAGTVQYAYNANGWVTSVTSADGVTRYEYNAAGELLRTDFPNSTSQILSRNNRGQIFQSESIGSSGVLERFTYTYDAAGRKASVAELSGRTVVYTYDRSGRLVEESTTSAGGGQQSVRYHYDPVGNRTRRDDSTEGSTVYNYDALDRLLAETQGDVAVTSTYDAKGNRLSRVSSSGDGSFYTWDALGRLESVTIVSSGVSSVVSYTYTPDGQRSSRTTEDGELKFVVDTAREYAQVVAEYTGESVVAASYVLPPTALGQVSSSRNLTHQYAHADSNNAILLVTGSTGEISEQIRYDGFGGIVTGVPTAPLSNLFNGEPRDAKTGLDYLRARHYDPSIGRFVSADPFPGFLSQPVTQNPYLYASADPINRTDPSGNFTHTELGVVLTINTILFAGIGAKLGSTVAKEFGASTISGAVIGGFVGGVAGFAAFAGAGVFALEGGVSVLLTTEVVAINEFVIPFVLLDAGALSALFAATFGILVGGEALGFIGTVQTIVDQSSDIGGNIPFSSLRPEKK